MPTLLHSNEQTPQPLFFFFLIIYYLFVFLAKYTFIKTTTTVHHPKILQNHTKKIPCENDTCRNGIRKLFLSGLKVLIIILG